MVEIHHKINPNLSNSNPILTGSTYFQTYNLLTTYLQLTYKHCLGPEKICLLEGGFMMSSDTDYQAEVNKIIRDQSIRAIAVFGYKGDLDKVRYHVNSSRSWSNILILSIVC